MDFDSARRKAQIYYDQITVAHPAPEPWPKGLFSPIAQRTSLASLIGSLEIRLGVDEAQVRAEHCEAFQSRTRELLNY